MKRAVEEESLTEKTLPKKKSREVQEQPREVLL